MLVAEPAGGVDIGQDGVAEHLVFAFPLGKTGISFLNLRHYKAVVAGQGVLLFQDVRIERPPGDGGRGIEKIEGLAFVVVEELDEKFVRSFGQRERDLFEDGTMGSIVFKEQLAVNIEAGAVVRAQLEGVFFGFFHAQIGFEEHGEVVGRIGQFLQVEVLLDPSGAPRVEKSGR